MAVGKEFRHSLHISLRGRDNETYRGTLVLKNWTLLYPGAMPADMRTTSPSTPGPDDPTGASYYVIAVVLVYGMSIVALIASHIKRKHSKLIEDKQIHKYLQEFMVVKETSNRENYKSLKRSIVQKLNWEKNPTYRNLSRAIIPAIAVPVGRQLNSMTMDAEMSEQCLQPQSQPPGRRSRRGSSPALSLSEQGGDTYSGKQRRKGMGNLFGPPNSMGFQHSVLEKLTELNDLRQEARTRANSIAFSSVSACSLDANATRISEAESVTGSDRDNQSEDSHITLPAITICRPSYDPIPLSRTHLPTIVDTETCESSANDLSETSDDDDLAYGRHRPVSSDDGLDTDREDIWLMGQSDLSINMQVHCNDTVTDKTGMDNNNTIRGGLTRHVHFSGSTKRKSGSRSPRISDRRSPIALDTSDTDFGDESESDGGELLQITCV